MKKRASQAIIRKRKKENSNSWTIPFARWVDKYGLGAKCVFWGVFQTKKKLPKNPKSIAFVKLWAIGDSVTTLPLIKAVKNQYPKSKIIVIATTRNADVYKEQKFIDEIRIFSIKECLKIIFQPNKYDLVFDLEPYFNFSALLTNYLGKYCSGFSGQTRSVLYDHKSKFPKDRHMVETYQDMGKPFRIKRINKLLKLNVSKKDQKMVENFLKKNQIKKQDLLVGIAPGAAESSRQRMWPKERFAKLADNLIKNKKAKIVWVGSPKEKELVESIQKDMANNSVSSCGKLNLKQTFNLIEQCKVFISNDTGPMHVAAAQGCRVLGLFGPNTPKRWAPFGKQNISLYHKIWCSPCIINEKGKMPPCINKDFQKCMKLISIEEVEKSVKKILG